MITDWRDATLHKFAYLRYIGVKGIYISSRDRVMAVGSGNLYFGSAPCNDNSPRKLV